MAKKSHQNSAMCLGRGSDRIMSWSSSLNIYRVNRFHPLPLTDPNKGLFSADSRYNERFDVIEELLNHNLTHVVEDIFEFAGFESTWRCLRVCHLWYDFIATHIFKRWADRMLKADSSLDELSTGQLWRRKVDQALDYEQDQEQLTSNQMISCGRICRQIHELREVWCNREPRITRLRCESFILSLRFVNNDLFCGLNNGSLQLWDLNINLLKKEQEIHDKGVKSLDVSEKFIASGSYDCTCKIWSRDTWNLLHVIITHADSVWDLRLHEHVLVTAGLDGIVGIFHINGSQLVTHSLMQANSDMVAAVDFNLEILITGSEDAVLALWDINTCVRTDVLIGHSGGITGIQLTGNTFVSSSYDGTVRLWSDAQTRHNFICLHIFNEPNSLLRCIGFNGSVVASGDFSGSIHFWNIEINGNHVKVKKYREISAHKSHVVCLQLNAQRMISGSRDKTVLIQDFWAKVPKLKIV